MQSFYSMGGKKAQGGLERREWGKAVRELRTTRKDCTEGERKK